MILQVIVNVIVLGVFYSYLHGTTKVTMTKGLTVMSETAVQPSQDQVQLHRTKPAQLAIQEEASDDSNTASEIRILEYANRDAGKYALLPNTSDS